MDNYNEEPTNVQFVFDRNLHWQSTLKSAQSKLSTRYLNTLSGVVIAIQEGSQKQEEIAKLRQLKTDSLNLDKKSDDWHLNKNKRDAIKATLPVVSLYQFVNNWRKTENFMQGSDVVCIDLDDLTPVTAHSEQYTTASHVRDLIAQYDACICAFVSPSGFGVKAIFYVPTFNNKDELEQAYRTIKAFVYKDYGLNTDDQASGLTSTINLSHDPDIYSNTHPIKLKMPIAPLKPVRKAFVPASSGIDGRDYNQRYIDAAIKQEMSTLSTSESGTHNKTLYKCSVNIFSILAGANSGDDKMDSIGMELLSIAKDIGHDTKRAMRTIKSARNDGESSPRKGLPKKRKPLPRKLSSFVNRFNKKSTSANSLADFINKTNN